MRSQPLFLGALLGASIAATASGTSGALFPTLGENTAQLHPLSISQLASPDNITQDQAARLAKQATFGPTPELIDQIMASGSASNWIDYQLGLSGSTYADIASKPVPTNYCLGRSDQDLLNCNRDAYSIVPVAMRFYSNAVGENDQLRQRTAFALSQILVASDAEVHTTAGLATYNEILLKNSLGNYRDILASITLNPFMGDYLDMVDSYKSIPNENFARELMQLFSIGTVLLNKDGTPQTDDLGATVPAYTVNDVRDMARALTGWTHARFTGAATTSFSQLNYSVPMVESASRFDSGAKTFLGRKVDADMSQVSNVNAVVDAVFFHPNTPTFISKRLIQQLVTPNPSPAYVQRVSSAFSDNGSGVRGDMRAVVKAILLDDEARVLAHVPGKVKEPVLLATSIARAVGVKSDGYAFLTRDTGLGQRPFSAPSVFNNYPYDFPMPQSGGSVSPVSKIMTLSTIVARHNLIYDWTVGGDTSRGEFQPQPLIPGSTGTQPNWTSWEALGTDDGKIVDRVNLLLLNGTMTKAQRQSMLAAMAQVKNSSAALQTRKRAQVALYIAASSPLFQVDR